MKNEKTARKRETEYLFRNPFEITVEHNLLDISSAIITVLEGYHHYLIRFDCDYAFSIAWFFCNTT